ncbi:hypothetical protein [Streptomyces sp. NPDC059349]|uniref:hypothetical protein n=1 Tax=Streptomyces sp. NPDC059349 TaxID=3346808 RepID=UPI0036B2FF9A
MAESDEGEVVRHTFCRVERLEASVITLPAAVVSMEQPAVDPAGARSGVGAGSERRWWKPSVKWDAEPDAGAWSRA